MRIADAWRPILPTNDSIPRAIRFKPACCLMMAPPTESTRRPAARRLRRTRRFVPAPQQIAVPRTSRAPPCRTRSERRVTVRRSDCSELVSRHPARPSPVAFQATAGPSSGHALIKPVSGEILSRSGPRHCGHSAFSGDRSSMATDGKTTTANSTRPRKPTNRRTIARTPDKAGNKGGRFGAIANLVDARMRSKLSVEQAL